MKDLKTTLNELKNSENPVEKINELLAKLNEKELTDKEYNSQIDELKKIEVSTSFNELTDEELRRLEFCFAIDTTAAAWRKKLNWKNQNYGYVVSYSVSANKCFVWKSYTTEKLMFPTERVAEQFIEYIGQDSMRKYFGI